MTSRSRRRTSVRSSPGRLLIRPSSSGGVQLALSHGIPIIAAGTTEDKAEVSARVAHTGVGINLGTQCPEPGQIRAAVRRIFAEPHYADAARRIRAEITTSGREDRAAELLEQLALQWTSAASETAG